MTTETITRDDLSQKFLEAANSCVDKASDGDAHEANLQAGAAHTFVAAAGPT